MFFLELAKLDLVKLDNPTTYICLYSKTLFANKLSHFLESKFEMIRLKQSDA